jgi:hypothetical protein
LKGKVMDENRDYVFDPRGYRTPEGGWVGHIELFGPEIQYLRAKADFLERFVQIMDEATFWF